MDPDNIQKSWYLRSSNSPRKIVKFRRFTSGMQIRDWLYVNHCQAILDIILKGEVGQIYNIAGRNEINNLEMIDSILRRIGRAPNLLNTLTIGKVTILDTA